MYNILYISSIFCITFGLVYGNECEKKNDRDMGCPVYKIESQNQCQSYVKTNDGKGDFVFYIKPLHRGQLSISLHKRHSPGISEQLTANLFTRTINDASVWYKIKIRRGNTRKQLFSSKLWAMYFFEVNDHPEIQSSEIEAGNEIRVKTVSSLWSFTCDPRQYQPPPQPPTTPRPPTQSLLPPNESLQPPPPPPPAKTTNASTSHSEPDGYIPVWQLAMIGAITSVLTLMVILVTVFLVLRHKKKNTALTEPTDYQLRLSRHVSENSLYGSYDNHYTGENQVPHVLGSAAGTEWGGHGTCVNLNYEEVNPQDTSAINSSSITANQRRGSAHDSENSLYMGFK